MRRRNRFQIGLGAIALVAFLLRLAYVTADRSHPVKGDGLYYHLIAGLLADGKGFIEPNAYLKFHHLVPWAAHPPAWPLTLAAAALVGLRTTFEQQVVACLIGTATVVVIGLAGRRIGRGSTGLVAAAIATVYPNFWLYERELMSETLTLLEAASIVLLAYRFRDRPTLGRALALGFACGLLAITHAEQLLLVAALLVPWILLTRVVPMRTRVTWLVAAGVLAAVVILPWAAYNTSRFHRPVLLGTQFGATVALANCKQTYAGSHIGFQNAQCRATAEASGNITGKDVAAKDDEFRNVGVQYARDHLSRVPIVVAAREARTWGLPMSRQFRFDTSRGTSLELIEVAFATYWLLVPAAIAGIVLLRRRRIAMLPLLAFAVTVTVGTALTYGYTRFRAASEVALVLLAAVAIDVVARRLFYLAPIPRE